MNKPTTKPKDKTISNGMIQDADIEDTVNDFEFDKPMRHGEVRTIEVLGVKVDYRFYDKYGVKYYDLWCARGGFETSGGNCRNEDILGAAKRVAMTHILQAIRDGNATLVWGDE